MDKGGLRASCAPSLATLLPPGFICGGQLVSGRLLFVLGLLGYSPNDVELEFILKALSE